MLDDITKAVNAFDAKRKELAERPIQQVQTILETVLNVSESGVSQEGIFYNFLVPISCDLRGIGILAEGVSGSSLSLVVRRKIGLNVKTDTFAFQPGLNEISETIPLVKGSLLSLSVTSSSAFNIESLHITISIGANARI